MNKILFPILNLEININKIAFSIGNIEIYWYAILITLSFIASLIIFKIKDKKFNIKFSDILDLVIFIIPISIVSARIYYIVFNVDYYITNPIKMFNLRNGGLAIYGGIIGGAITCYIFCRKRKINVLDLFDYIVPCLALRTIHRKMGKLYKSRSVRIRNRHSLENGNIRNGKIYRSSSNFFI